MQDISTRTSLGSLETSMVARAGFVLPGKKAAYVSFMRGKSLIFFR
jgi:hypothetical protein